MSCNNIYENLRAYSEGDVGEPYAKWLCGEALAELAQIAGTVLLFEAERDSLLLEIRELKAQLADVNRMIEARLKTEKEDWFKDRGYA